MCRESSLIAGLLQALRGRFCPVWRPWAGSRAPWALSLPLTPVFCVTWALAVINWVELPEGRLFWICAASRMAERELGTVSLPITSDSVQSRCFGEICMWILYFFPWAWPRFYSDLRASDSFCALPCVTSIKTMLSAAQRQVFLKNLQAQLTAKPCQLVGLWAMRENLCDLQHVSLACSTCVVRIWTRVLLVLLALWHLSFPASSRMMSSRTASLLLFCMFRFGALGESLKSEMERNAWSHLILPLPTQDYSPQYSLECLLQSIFKWLKGEGFPLLPGEAGSAVQETSLLGNFLPVLQPQISFSLI